MKKDVPLVTRQAFDTMLFCLQIPEAKPDLFPSKTCVNQEADRGPIRCIRKSGIPASLSRKVHEANSVPVEQLHTRLRSNLGLLVSPQS